MIVNPPKHIIAYGIAGTGKSYFASTLETPQLIAMFDPYGKESPYTNGTFVVVEEHEVVANGNKVMIPVWTCFEDEDQTIILRKILWFSEPDNTKPIAYEAYAAMQPQLMMWFKMYKIKTFILDSVTALCVTLMGKFDQEGTVNARHPNLKIEDSPRGWANLATSELEWINQWVNSLPINTCCICHTAYDTSDKRPPDSPTCTVHAYGRMRERLLMTSGDVYHAVRKDGKYLMELSSDLYATNNSLGLQGTFPNNWPDINKQNKTRVMFVERKKQNA